MKIFSWMQSKLYGKQKPAANTNNHHMAGGTSSKLEEFSDWPQSLLAIGTFGIITSNLRSSEYPSTAAEQDVVEEDDDELISSFFDTEVYEEDQQLVVLNNNNNNNNNNKDVQQGSMMSRSSAAAGNKDINILVDDQKNINIRKKSLTFLLKTIFTSKNKLRGSFPTSCFDKSRMDKILRAILNKKIHPQTSSKGLIMPNTTRKDDEISDDDDDDNEGSMWVKTDSEYIVLEI